MQTNADGTFVISGLPPGDYTITIAKPGFQTYQESQDHAASGNTRVGQRGDAGGRRHDAGVGRRFRYRGADDIE